MALSKDELWKIGNETPVEIMARGSHGLEEFIREEPRIAAEKLYALALQCHNLKHARQSDAWQKYHSDREEWQKTYNAALTGLYAAAPIVAPHVSHQRAEEAATQAHDAKPQPPEST